MAEYLSPGVYVEEFDSGPAPMQGAGTSTAGFIGLAQRGPTIGEPQLVTNPADFSRKFGGYLSTSEFGDYRYLAFAVNHFFANGGGRAFIMRVAPPDAELASIMAGDESLRISAKNVGAWGNGISISFTPSSKAKTQFLEEVGAGMYLAKQVSDFNVGDVVVADNGTDTEYNVIGNIDGNEIHFANPFSMEVVDSAVVPTTSIRSCEFDMEVKFGDLVESYQFLSFNIEISNYLAKQLSKSELVSVEIFSLDAAKDPMEALRAAFGSDKTSFKILLKDGKNGTAAALSDGDFIGTDNGPGSRTGIQAFLDNSDVSIMAVPGNVSPNVQLALVSHCENLASRFAVLDMPMESKSVSDIMKHRNIVDSDYSAMYHPWLEVYDPLDKKNTFIPPSGSVIGIYARSDNTRGVHKAPANEVVSTCTGLYCNYNTGEQDLLNPKGVNLIRQFPGSGIRVWGARTASSRPLWKYVNVRRLFIFLEETIKMNTNWVVFEPNDELLWIRVRRTIEVFLEGVWRSGALAGSTAGEAFFVNIGPSTMSKDDIDNGRLICVIGVAPVKPAEFVIFRLTQKTGD